MTYTITLEEIIDKDFTVEAKSEIEAIEIAINKYKNSEFVLDGDSCVTYKMVGIDGEFKEF